MMKVVLLLALLSVSEGVTSRVAGLTGGRVTLSCKYDVGRDGALAACWVRGSIPASGCGQQLVSTDGHEVKEATRASSRYQLLGALGEGDVSLTILNVSETDAGRYGCRVEIPGWFNDDKHHFDLVVERAAQTTPLTASTASTASARETTPETTTGQVTTTERLLTSSTSSVTAEENSSKNSVLLVFLIGLLTSVTLGAVLIIMIRRRRLSKMPQQQLSPPSALQLQSRGSAMENIYQIDEGGEYEYCP